MLIRALPVDPAARRRRGAGHRRRRSVPRRRCASWPSDCGVGRARDIHRRRARRRAARAPRAGRRVRDAVPHPRRRPGRRGPGHRVPGGLGHRRAGGRRAHRVARRKPCSTTRLGSWSTAARWTQIADAVSELLADPDRAAAMGAAGRDWVDRAAGAGTRWPAGWPSCADRAARSPWRRSLRYRRRTSRPPPCA